MKTKVTKKNAISKFCRSLVGLFAIDNSTNIEGDSEYVALMRRRDELIAYKMDFGYDEEKQKELENINKRLQEYVK